MAKMENKSTEVLTLCHIPTSMMGNGVAVLTRHRQFWPSQNSQSHERVTQLQYSIRAMIE